MKTYEMTTMFLCFLLVSLACPAQSGPVESAGNSSSEDYDEETASGCACQNGGICAMDNDFCVCKHGFTGRYCEVDLRADAAFRLSCADFYHGQTENHGCASCRCFSQVLTCTAYVTPVCAASQQLRREHLDNKLRRRAEDLGKLLARVDELERATYEAYISFYKSQMAFEVAYVDTDASTSTDEPEVSRRRLSTSSSSGLEKRSPSTGGNQLLVLTSSSGGSDRIVGLYFPQAEKPADSAAERFIQEDREQSRLALERYYSLVEPTSTSSSSSSSSLNFVASLGLFLLALLLI